jgi:predicted RNA-binding Zn-ribbon protein involved in translation (DUF1610 family)
LDDDRQTWVCLCGTERLIVWEDGRTDYCPNCGQTLEVRTREGLDRALGYRRHRISQLERYIEIIREMQADARHGPLGARRN